MIRLRRLFTAFKADHPTNILTLAEVTEMVTQVRQFAEQEDMSPDFLQAVADEIMPALFDAFDSANRLAIRQQWSDALGVEVPLPS